MKSVSTRILLIEDELDYAGLLEKKLAAATEPFEIESASSLAEGIEKIQQTAFDAVVLDLNLPDSKGSETVTRLHAAAPQLPIVVLSGLDDETIIYDVLHGGAQEYLVKDATALQVLPRTIAHAIARKKVALALKHSTERWWALFEHNPAETIVVDREGRVTDINAARRASGDRPPVLGDRMYVDYAARHDVDMLGELMQCIETGESRNFPEQKYGDKVLSINIEPFPADNPRGAIITSQDITERKRAEERIRLQQYYLEKAQEMGQIGTWELDLINNKLYWTDENCRIFGVPEGSVVNYAIFLEKVHPDDREYVDREWMAGIGGKPYDIEHRILVDGKVRWVREKADVTFDNKGTAVSAIGFTQDITDRKQAEEGLKKEQSLQIELLDRIPNCVAMIIKKGTREIIASNAAAREMGAVPGKTCFQTCAGRDDDCPFCLAPRLWETDQPQRIEVEYRGEWYEGIWESLSEDSYVHYIYNITERKRDQEEIERLARFPSENPNPVLRVSAEGAIEYANSAAGSLFAAMAEPDGNRLASPWRDRIAEIITAGSSVDEELRSADRVFQVTFAPVPDHGYANLYARDVTDRLQLEAQLRQSQKLESIGTLAGGVAHEINNPINGIMNYAQLILDRLGPDSPVSEFATEIGNETRRVAAIVRNLLDFSRPKKEEYSPARMCDIVEATLSLIRATIRHDQIALEVDVAEDLPEIKCRSQQIQQVIMNLLTNARDALNEKYPGSDKNKIVRISARLNAECGTRNAEGFERGTANAERGREVRTRNAEGREEEASSALPNSDFRVPSSDAPRSAFRVRLTVEDHGIGIPDAVREHLFDPFFTSKRPDRGTGLGISISYAIVKEHGGKLGVESEVGKWTRFHVDLPISDKGCKAFK